MIILKVLLLLLSKYNDIYYNNVITIYLYIKKNKVKVREKYNYKEIIREYIGDINKGIIIYNLIKEGYIYTVNNNTIIIL
ncbi:MAG: hypothetical protein ACLUG3_06780 [Bacilli bacterium]